MTLFLMLVVLASLSGLTMAGLALAFRSSGSKAHRVREEPVRKLRGRAYVVRTAVNGILSVTLVFGLVYLLYDHVFYEGPAPWWRYPVEAVGILFAYDFLYYLLHRFPFHAFGPLKRVHAVHHMAKYPTAIDSLYLDPIENVLGVSLFMACTFLIGPVSIYSFAAAFFVYSQLNVIIHGGLEVPLLGGMVRKHDQHHTSMRAGNYASITPLPDILFGTAE